MDSLDYLIYGTCIVGEIFILYHMFSNSFDNVELVVTLVLMIIFVILIICKLTDTSEKESER